MKLLILTANTGEGHNSAAKALQEYFEAHGHSCHVQDGRCFMSWIENEIVCRGHVFLYRKMPKVFGLGYRIGEQISRRQRFQKTLDHLKPRAEGSERPPSALKAHIEDNGYDAVICCHVFAARSISRLRRTEGLSVPSFFLCTDYTCSPSVNQFDMDGWFIPHPALIPEFISYGIPPEKLLPSGIPVRNEFFSRQDKAAVRQKLGLPQDKKIAVLSCGSMGAGAMGRLAFLLAETLPRDALLIAICGSNRKLEKRLKKLPSKKLMVMGFVDRMSDYLDAADLFLTKPGGLSTTEAMHKRLPLILINVAPGCETRNMEFLTGLGCASSASGAISLARLTAITLRSGDNLDEITHRCAKEFSMDSREFILHTVEDAVRKNNCSR